MTEALTLRLPYPPALNNLYRNAPGRGRVATQRYLTWSRHAGNELLSQVRGRRPVFLGMVEVDIRLSRPDKRRRDIDGTGKAILDRLTGIAYTDDSQVVDLRLRWADGAKPGAIVIVRAA